jgi:BolA family transcriptional regulator, general stress-responsive regulator
MSRTHRIEERLMTELSPVYLLVEDESKFHHVPQDAETHIKITAVSPAFEQLSRLNRHKMLNQLLHTEFEQGLHALSMHLYTPEEWDKVKNNQIKSPTCRDGYKNK